jgi:hypothetical protein
VNGEGRDNPFYNCDSEELVAGASTGKMSAIPDYFLTLL